MCDGRILENAVTEIEDVRPSGECVKDATDRHIQTRAPRQKRQGIEIALDGQPGRKLLVRPDRIHGLIEADRVDAGLTGIGRKLSARALRKPDELYVRMPFPNRRGDAGLRSNDPPFEL